MNERGGMGERKGPVFEAVTLVSPSGFRKKPFPRFSRAMAARKRIIALFDVDGTLTLSRKVRRHAGCRE
jgi:hypothetical protein